MAVTADAYWLGLRRVRGVGPRTCRLLLEQFGSAEAVFAADESRLAGVGIPKPTARNIVAFTDFAPLEQELCELPRIGARMVRWTDSDYPEALRHIADPPPYFFVRGDSFALNRHAIAIVGARAASDAGRRMAQRLALELAAKGFAVVSGLARGIDSEAHQGALDGGGRTVAVMGCGIDIIYPPENRKLAEAIVESGGAILSELPVGTPPIAENFPSRNRLISGLSMGVVIVEAAEKSGSLITARMALEQDRQVFAVPGSPVSGKTRGSNRLLKEGARLVECVEDVIEELAPQFGASASADMKSARKAQTTEPARSESAWETESAEVKLILRHLKESDKLHVDSVIEGSGLSTQTVLKLLLELELRGLVTQHPGKLFSLA
ncbi:MAG TPA: DNA-processing protein DprA [Candidatus Binataceae bacterium]|nr:DNA-processing protein DprA [Candidatus Binataceae bacterium]